MLIYHACLLDSVFTNKRSSLFSTMAALFYIFELSNHFSCEKGSFSFCIDDVS